MKSKLLFVYFLFAILIILLTLGTIKYVNQIPAKITAAYKKQVWNEITQFIIDYPNENLTLFELAFKSRKDYERELENAIIDEFGENKYDLFKSMYDSIKTYNPEQARNVFYGMEKEEVARDSLWFKLKRDFKKKILN